MKRAPATTGLVLTLAVVRTLWLDATIETPAELRVTFAAPASGRIP